MGRKVQVVLALIVALGVLVGVVAYVVETDEEAIVRITEECRDAFLDGDADRILAHLDPEATGSVRIGRGSLAENARRAVREYSRRVTAIEFVRKEIRIDGDKAEGRWLAWVKLKDAAPGIEVGVFKLSARIEYRRSAEGWRILRLEVGAP